MIDTMAETIASAFRKTFPELHIMTEYPRTMAGLKTPCLIFELVSGEGAGNQPATGQLDLETHWEARLVFAGKAQASHRLLARNAAVTLASFVQGNNFGVPSSLPARFIRMADDGGDPAVPTLEVWCLEWVQLVRLGKDLNEDGTEWLPQRIHIVRENGESGA